MSNQLESTAIATDTSDLVERLVFAYACALAGFKRFPTHRDREKARLMITSDPAWERVGLPSKADVAALLRQHGIAMPDPLVD